MKDPIIRDYNLEFVSLTPRENTEVVIIHHTGNFTDDDMNAQQIHFSHLNQGWSGCGYHYIVRKDGMIERGRPEWAVGAHAQGYNWDSIGIHLSGNFELANPTLAQIESVSYLVGWVCERYGLTPNPRTVIGHRDLMATACPGRFLYEQMQTIRGKAIWYQQHY